MAKIIKIIWMFFLVIGVVFLITGLPLFSNELNNENKIETKGIITYINSYKGYKREMVHDVKVSYEVDGKQYESYLNVYSSDFYKGKEIDIYYKKNNPNLIGIKSADLIICSIFPIIGITFTITGVIGLISIKGKKYLKNKGVKIYADYVETIVNRRFSVNGVYPYTIICYWFNPDDNKTYKLKSENIWENPINTINEKQIKSFPVYFDLKNKRKYYMDIEILTEDIIDLT